MLIKSCLLRASCSLLFSLTALMITACVSTDDKVQQASVKIEPSIISVSTPGMAIPQGAKFAWLLTAINIYQDERLDSTTIQYLIENNIKANLADMGFRFVESESVADYTIAYTAALESSLDDTAILRRYGLVPGNMRVPDNNPLYEKGTLLIYAFDNSTGDVVWRSAVQSAVDFSLSQEQRKARIEPIIQDMFRTLPTR